MTTLWVLLWCLALNLASVLLNPYYCNLCACMDLHRHTPAFTLMCLPAVSVPAPPVTPTVGLGLVTFPFTSLDGLLGRPQADIFTSVLVCP
ncbi:hypothetical protein DdX_05701 [Ditylenchus destructor]|uniref:Secreted peptide n=1 Tax=Ditylenchus destructor TaxID=166010 RepID=A0AAD4NCM0_9BILA|nr:hypothetical protein DdX_05701 [Ditylenchus destructor]